MLTNKTVIVRNMCSGGQGTIRCIEVLGENKFYILKEVNKCERINKCGELGTLLKVNRHGHPFVVELLDFHSTLQKDYFVFEHYVCDLFELISSGGRITERVARMVFVEIALGLDFIHSLKIIHR